jgi:hypothetical protein
MRGRFEGAETFATFLAGVREHEDFWHSMARRAKVPAEYLDRTRALAGRWHLLVLLEDWCGDAINTVPLISALAEASPNLELRVLGRDANPDLMDTHLSNGSRSIPVVMVLDHEFREVGWWGSRPSELQEWVVTQGLQLPPEERYAEIRRWYARDGGRTTLEEIVSLLERCQEAAGAVA